MSIEEPLGWLQRLAAAGSVEATVLHHCLWTLECAYWEDVDNNQGRLAAEFYCDDAIFDVGLPGARIEGKASISEFYAGRRNQGPRTSLHLVSNFALYQWNGNSASTRAIVSLIANDGELPQPMDFPLLIVSAETEYRMVEGSWKIAARLNYPRFVNNERDLVKRVTSARKS